MVLVYVVVGDELIRLVRLDTFLSNQPKASAEAFHDTIKEGKVPLYVIGRAIWAPIRDLRKIAESLKKRERLGAGGAYQIVRAIPPELVHAREKEEGGTEEVVHV